MFLFETPTTANVSFSDIFIDQSINKEYGFRFPEVTQARANIRALLKEIKAAEHGEKDYLRLVKVRSTAPL
jgi:hypothetical protein